jgi:nucleoside-diphosphate-sugar epimerase
MNREKSDRVPPNFGEVMDEYRGKVVAISGASGYIGINLVRALVGVDCRIVRVGRTALPPSPPGTAVIDDLVGDMDSADLWAEAIASADVVFHLAAQTSLYVADEDPVADFSVNVLPMLRLIEACRSAERTVGVVFAGTVTQAGLPARLPVDESHPDLPVTIYDIHKLMAEKYLRNAQCRGWIEGGTLRLANVFGPGPSSAGFQRGVLNVMIRRAIAGEALTVYRPGDLLRDYLYIDDVVGAFLLAGANTSRLAGRNFVVGSGEGRTLLDIFATVARQVAAATGQRANVDEVDPPDGLHSIEFRSFVADSSAFCQLTGWRPKVEFVEGIDRTVETFLKWDSPLR